MFLGNTTYSLQPGVYKSVSATLILRVILRWIREVEILSVASCDRNGNKLRPDGDLTYLCDLSLLRCHTLSTCKVSVFESFSTLSVHECFAFRDMFLSFCNVLFSGSSFCKFRNVTNDHKYRL